MKKIFSICSIGFTAVSLLSGCQPRDDGTKQQLAALQEQLAKQQEKENERLELEKQRQQEREREERDAEIYRQAEEDFKNRQILEEERKAEEQKALKQKAQSQRNENQTPNQAAAVSNKKHKEKLARYPAFVITESGQGTLNLRGAPSTSAVSVTRLHDGQQVQVTATTNARTTDGGTWVKVQVDGVTGYVSDRYLQAGKPENDFY